jgi:hypothetical protein
VFIPISHIVIAQLPARLANQLRLILHQLLVSKNKNKTATVLGIAYQEEKELWPPTMKKVARL